MDRQISAAIASRSSEGLKNQRCLNTCGVALGHVRETVEAGKSVCRFSSQGGCI
jgi:hypothetical protein